MGKDVIYSNCFRIIILAALRTTLWRNEETEEYTTIVNVR